MDILLVLLLNKFGLILQSLLNYTTLKSFQVFAVIICWLSSNWCDLN